MVIAIHAFQFLLFSMILNGEKLEIKFKQYNGKEIRRISKHNLETVKFGINSSLRCVSECLKKKHCNNAILRGKNCTLFTSCQNSEYYEFIENAILLEKKSKCQKSYSTLTLKMNQNLNNNDVFSLAVLLDGSLAISSDEEIRILNIENQYIQTNLYQFIDRVYSSVVLHNGDLAIGLDNGKIKIIDSQTGLTKITLNDNFDKVFSLAVLLNGDLASGSGDAMVRIWDLENGLIKKDLKLNQNIKILAVLYNGNLAILSGMIGIDIWNVENGSVILTLNDFSNEILCLTVLHSDDLVIGLGDGSIKIWDLKVNLLKKTLFGHSDKVFSVVVLFNGELASISRDGKIKIWNLENELNYTFLTSMNEKSILAVLNNGDLVGISKNYIQIWGLESEI